MDATLHQLGEILLKAVPTFLLVILLHYYLKAIFFKPLKKVLRERYDVTDGARQQAKQSLENAAAKIAKYEAAIRAARAEVYQGQEKHHKELQEREAADLKVAREKAEAAVKLAKEQLAKEVEEAKASLTRESETLAERIAETILRSAA
jgi:F-type H+-transporting ATPase subunit b